MGVVIALLLIWSLFAATVSIRNLRKIKFAQHVVNDIYNLHRMGIINSVQAKVLLNELDNPLDTVSVREVRWQIDEIIQKERLNASQGSNR